MGRNERVKTFTATVERDGDDLVLVFSQAAMKAAGLKVGDEIAWSIGTDGTVVITPTLGTGSDIVFDANDIIKAKP